MAETRTPRRSRTIMAVAAGASALVIAGLSLTTAEPSSAHGSLGTPIARQQACFNLRVQHWPGGASTNEACNAAYRVGGGDAFWNWNEIQIVDTRLGNFNPQYRTLIPDGQLCGAGTPRGVGLNVARDDWPSTDLPGGGSEFPIFYRTTAVHNPYVHYMWTTKAGYDPNTPLRWNDLEQVPMLVAYAPHATGENEGRGFVMPTRLPNLSGQQLIYSIWQGGRQPSGAIQSNEIFASCADVSYGAPRGAGIDTTAPDAPADVAVDVDGSGDVDVTWDPADPADDVANYAIYSDGALVDNIAPDEDSATLADLADSDEHDLTIVAVDEQGNASEPSDPVTLDAVEKDSDDVAVNVLGVTALSPTTAKVTWRLEESGASAESFEITSDGEVVATVPGTEFEAVVGGLEPGSESEIEVVAIGGRTGDGTAADESSDEDETGADQEPSDNADTDQQGDDASDSGEDATEPEDADESGDANAAGGSAVVQAGYRLHGPEGHTDGRTADDEPSGSSDGSDESDATDLPDDTSAGSSVGQSDTAEPSGGSTGSVDLPARAALRAGLTPGPLDVVRTTTADLADVSDADADVVIVGGIEADEDEPGTVLLDGDRGLRADVADAAADGARVVLSLGGEGVDLQIQDRESADALTESVGDLMDRYGFDGVDVALDSNADPYWVNAALQRLRARMPDSFVLTLSPTSAQLASAGTQYERLAANTKGFLTAVVPRVTDSSGALGCDGRTPVTEAADRAAAALCAGLAVGLAPGQLTLAADDTLSQDEADAALACVAEGEDCGAATPASTFPDLSVLVADDEGDARSSDRGDDHADEERGSSDESDDSDGSGSSDDEPSSSPSRSGGTRDREEDSSSS